MKKNIFLSLILGIFLVLLISGCAKENNETSKVFGDNTILSHLYIGNVKISNINSLNDIFNNFKNSQVSYVSVCYNDKDVCSTYTYDEVLSEQIITTNITTLTFGIMIPFQNNLLNLDFTTYYTDYKENKENSKYFSLELMESNGIVKLDNAYLELLPLSDIEKNYTIATRSTNYIYYVDFTSLDGDTYYLEGYASSSNIKIFNVSKK